MMRSFPDVLAARLRHDPGSPLVTAFDDATGERVELSTTTYANWVAKTANLLSDELMLEPGDTVRLDLPVHWLVPVFLGAAWSAGLVVTTDADKDAALVVTGPQLAEAPHVLACSLLPFAVRFADPLPDGVVDYGLEWPGQSDVFVASTPVDAGTVAWSDRTTQGQLVDQALRRPCGRLLTDVHPAHERGVPAFLHPLVGGGSLVLVSNPDPARWPARREDERATDELGGFPS